MCTHTTMCPHTPVYVSSYYYICVLTPLDVSAYYDMCVLILLFTGCADTWHTYIRPPTTTSVPLQLRVSTPYYIRVPILLHTCTTDYYMCPHPPIYVSAHRYTVSPCYYIEASQMKRYICVRIPYNVSYICVRIPL